MPSESPREWLSAELEDVTLLAPESSAEDSATASPVDTVQPSIIELRVQPEPVSTQTEAPRVETPPALTEAEVTCAKTSTATEVPASTDGQLELKDAKNWTEIDGPASYGKELPPLPAEFSHPVRRKWLASETIYDLKQAFNVMYFTLAGISFLFLADYWNLPLLKILGCLAFALCVTAFAFLLKKRTAPTADVWLPIKISKRIRTYALITPMPLILIAMIVMPSEIEYRRGVELNKQKNYSEAALHLAMANALGSTSEKTLDALSLSYNRTSNRLGALEAAEAALRINPNDDEALAQKAWALDAMNRSDEAIPAALASIKINPRNGIGAGALAYAYYHNGQYELAEGAATRHIVLHNDESTAYNLRADIYEKLGEDDKALADRLQASRMLETLLKASAASRPNVIN